MLAQNFKMPADLGIEDAEFDALVKTLGMLERQEVEYFPVSNELSSKSRRNPPKGFNMLFVNAETECGTAACMMGWARELMGDRDLFRRELSPELSALFCTAVGAHGSRGKAAQDIQPAEGAAALRNFLTYGAPRWPQVFASE